jgi:hypothetical protein
MNLLDFITKIGEDINIKLIDNGFLVEVSGRNANDDWKTVKLACSDRSELDSLIDQCLEIDRDN